MSSSVGFIGLGVMGTPMASNLVAAGTSLVIWNRTPDKCAPLRERGAIAVDHVHEVFQRTTTIILMLFDCAAIDQVLGRGTPLFAQLVRGRTIVNMSSIAPEDARALGRDVAAAGGQYVEAPVSGSRIPAEEGRLVAMLAGDPLLAERLHPVLAPMCHAQIFCGPVGNGLLMKLAVNLFLLVMANGLAEAVHFSDCNGLRRIDLQAVLDAGPMASAVSRLKLAKIIAGDHSPQAAIADALNSTRLISSAARQAGAACDLIERCGSQFQEAFDLGYRAQDMSAVLFAIEAQAARRVPGAGASDRS